MSKISIPAPGLGQTVGPRRADLGNGHYMVTIAHLSSTILNHNAGLSVGFHEDMTCTNKIEGFTGGVQLSFYDSDGYFLSALPLEQNGINQGPLLGASHRAIDWNGAAPMGAQGMVLSQFHDPHNRAGWIGEATQWVIGALHDISLFVKGEVQAFEEELKKHPELIAGVDICGILKGSEFVVHTIQL